MTDQPQRPPFRGQNHYADLKREIKEIIELQLNDNVKARIIDRFDQNEYRRTNTDIPVRAQLETYFYFKRKLE